jgi:hypothetical protein
MSAPFDIALRSRFATRQDCLLPWREAEPQLPHRANRCSRRGLRNKGVLAIRHPNQCGIFRLEEGHFQILADGAWVVLRGPQPKALAQLPRPT